LNRRIHCAIENFLGKDLMAEAAVSGVDPLLVPDPGVVLPCSWPPRNEDGSLKQATKRCVVGYSFFSTFFYFFVKQDILLQDGDLLELRKCKPIFR
jgi:hypothetical protein